MAKALGVALALVLLAAALPAAASAASTGRCSTRTVDVVPGGATVLRLSCRRAGRVVAPGRSGRFALKRRPAFGTLGRLDARTGRVRLRVPASATGTGVLRFRLTTGARRVLRGELRLRVLARPSRPAAPPSGSSTAGRPAAPAPVATSPSPAAPTAPAAATAPTPAPAPAPTGDGLPPRLPLVPGSIASTSRAWNPAPQDSCPREVHDRFSVVGPDGKRYPAWHPPTATDPATGRSCTFGHEHGDDPRGSDLHALVAEHLASEAHPTFAGLGFGVAAEALESYAADGAPRRSEDHVGYKVHVLEDVTLTSGDGERLGVACDYLTMVHQGSHSADALSNNVHELLYAVACTDGTRLVSSTLSAFGDAGSFTRSCDPDVEVTTTDNGYPDGGGSRSIPDRTCVERDVLVPPGRSTSPFALYEVWSSENALRTSDGRPVARFDAAFGVFNPARYASATQGAARTLATCTEELPDGRRANGVDCSAARGITAWDDPASPFDGTRRDVFVGATALSGDERQARWWTDPYGGNASPTPFPGAVCQLVGPTGGAASAARTQVFKRGTSADAEGVHAPN